MSRILYIQTSGVDTPERLYAPFVLSSMAVAMGIEASIFFMIKGVTVMKKGAAEKIKIGEFPALNQLRDKALADGVKAYVCEQSVQLFGMSRGDFIEGAKIAGAATVNDLALEADAVISL